MGVIILVYPSGSTVTQIAGGSCIMLWPCFLRPSILLSSLVFLFLLAVCSIQFVLKEKKKKSSILLAVKMMRSLAYWAWHCFPYCHIRTSKSSSEVSACANIWQNVSATNTMSKGKRDLILLFHLGPKPLINFVALEVPKRDLIQLIHLGPKPRVVKSFCEANFNNVSRVSFFLKIKY